MIRSLIAAALLLLFVPALAQGAKGPGPVDAAAWLVMDVSDGATVGSSAARERRSVASATKLMTALVALEELGPTEEIEIEGYEASNPAESVAGLQRGQVFTTRELIAALLMVSANDAAVELARAAAGGVPAFVRLMNREARRLGLDDTRFSNPIGLDGPNHSTAADLAKLSAELLRVPLLARIVDMARTRIGPSGSQITLESTNALLAREPWVDGVKTGQTLNAGWVMIASGTRDRNRLVSVVLGASSEEARYSSALRLLNWGFGRYADELVAGDGEIVARVRIEDAGGDQFLQLRAAHALTASVRRDGPAVRTRIEAPDSIEGPIRRGQTLGELTAFAGDRRLGTVPLKASRAVGAPSVAGRSRTVFAVSLIAVGVLVIMAAVAGRRPRQGAENE